MGYLVYHSQLSCLTPVSGKLKRVTHIAHRQTHGDSLARRQPLSPRDRRKTLLMEARYEHYGTLYIHVD